MRCSAGTTGRSKKFYRCSVDRPSGGRKEFSVAALLAMMALVAGFGSPIWADSTLRLQNLQGTEVEPLKTPLPRATVFIFTRTDCPISNRYAPVIQELNKEFAAKGVAFWLIYVDPHQSAAEIQQHVKDYHYDLQVALDPKHKLVKLAAAVITPEAAVFSSQGQLLYHGRIDNRYVDIGRRLPAPTRNDLELTLNAVVAGKPVPEATAPAVGCYISDLE